MKKLRLIFIILAVSINLAYCDKFILETDCGSITIETFEDVAPKTAKSFKYLVKKRLYDGVTFHRIIKGFMIQTGDPLSKDEDPANDGTGGAKYKLKEEINADGLNLDKISVKDSYYAKMYPEDHPAQSLSLKLLFEKEGYKYRKDLRPLSHEFGVVSMANKGPGTGSSQFFIVTATDGAPWLDGRHTAFGKVIEGFETVKKIEALTTDKSNKPKDKIILKTIKEIR
ncbi:MAG: hypothetical protein CSB55_02035 [Candidatus Cloacimonadota bacterium]|nr:MAG: hypothetical protein CSB55_02035 [Candidatus Cloacimonadota bacterium]